MDRAHAVLSMDMMVPATLYRWHRPVAAKHGLSSAHTLCRYWQVFPSGWGKSLSPCNGWLCLTGQAVIRAEKHDTRIFIRGHIVHEPRMPSERRVAVLPAQVLTAQEIGIQRLQEGIVDRDRPNASRGDDMRRGSLTQDGVEERIPTAIAEIDQGCGGWQFLQGPVDMGTMATMDITLGVTLR